MDNQLLNRIKRLTIAALLADDLLMGVLVLKGGNALGLAYDMTSRGSLDIDFSMEKDFSEKEKSRIKNQASYLLNDEFNKEGLHVIDVEFVDKPGKIHESVKDFWGGYKLSFKIVTDENFKKYRGDQQAMRVRSVSLTSGDDKAYTVDISKYEYIGKVRSQEIDGTVIQVYTPVMLALEKLRAICQQDKEYRQIIISMTQRARARDFYDIYNLYTTFKLDFASEENVEMVKNIFDAKRVPLHFVCRIPLEYDLHFNDWESVVQTIGRGEEVKDFRFYFDFVIDTFSFLCA
jgi:predicted nucleotidyltransferase component of viral defense system